MDVYEFVRNVKSGKIKFPYKRLRYSNEDIHEMMENLKNYDHSNRIINKEYTIKNLTLNPSYYLFKGEYMTIISNPDDYMKFDILSDMFQEENRVKCSLCKMITPFDAFNKYPEKIALDCIKYYKTITPFNIRESLYRLYKECSSFRPNLLLTFIRIFKCRNILDFSAGWGDRLISAIAAGVKYTGIDSNEKLHPNYKKIIDFFCTESEKKKYTMIHGQSELITIPNKKYDMVFTSPPYFTFEYYNGNKNTQSSKYNKEEDWFNNFLQIVIIKVWKLLIINGYMCININQKKGQKYVKAMIDLINSFNNSSYLGCISYADQKITNPQPIFIWIKI